MWRQRLRLAWGKLTLPVRFDQALPPAARTILEELAGAGHEAGIVGGAVRDLIMGETPKDWDMVTSATTDEIRALFPEGRLIGSVRETGTVLVPREGQPYEITPYRGDGLGSDLSRRDFTINAMALGIDGRLVDPLGGQADLARGMIRACGSPGDRLEEDPLRMLRAVRLAAQFDFALDPDLTDAIGAAAPRLAEVASERTGMEFGRLLVTERPAWAVERLRELGLLTHLTPELLEMVGVEQNQYHAYNVWEHALMALALVPPQLPLRLAALLHDMAKPRCLSVDERGNRHFYRHESVGAEMADALLKRLRFDNQTRERVVHLVRFHMDLHQEGEVSDAALRRMIRRIGPEYMDDLIQLRRADRLASGTRAGELSPETIYLLQEIKRLVEADTALRVADLAVDGNDVMAAFGEGPGPHVGQVLERLLDEVTEDPALNSREWLLKRLEQIARS